MRILPFGAFGLGAFLLGACAISEPKPPKVPLSRRASNDLSCPASELHITSEDDKYWQVRGCDRADTYVKQCDECLDMTALALGVPMTNRCDCAWVPVTEARKARGNRSR